MSLETHEWMQLDEGSGPHERHWMSAIHDPIRDWAIIFAGRTEYNVDQVFGDTWAFNLATDSWIQLDMGGEDAPHRRYGHRAIFDPSGYRMIIYGGFDDVSNVHANDVWAFNLADFTWEQLRTGRHGELPVQPVGRCHHSAVYDPVTHQMIVHAGSVSDERFKDTWSFDLSTSGEAAHTWTRLADGPENRANHVAIYDDVRARMIIHGGYGDDIYASRRGDIWAYSAGSDTWTQVRETHLEGDPLGRDRHAGIYDPIGGGLVIYGGWTPSPVSECWSFCSE